MARRKLTELNLLDDFLIAVLISHPVIGEAFSREILRIIFKREFGALKIVPQKVYPGRDTDLHGARLDVYLEENLTDIELLEEDISEIEIPDEGTIIDLEPNQTDDKKTVKALPKRVRFYHAKIDTKALDSGERYQALKNVVVVMFTPFDPFGYGLMKYTIRNGIAELPDAKYENGAQTLFFHTSGTICNVDEEIKQLLRYMEYSVEENAATEALKRIHKMVETVKHDEEVSLQYMKAIERRDMWINKGKELERANTERERQRADSAEQTVNKMEKELEYWKNLALGIS